MASPTPRGNGEHPMLLAQVARRRRDDGAFGNHQLPARLNRHPDVFFTDELERLLAGRGRSWDRLAIAALKGPRYRAWNFMPRHRAWNFMPGYRAWNFTL